MIRVREIGWVYLPWSVAAWVIGAALLALCAQVFVAIDLRSHSVTDTLYGVFPFWASAFLLWNWVGSRASMSGSKSERTF